MIAAAFAAENKSTEVTVLEKNDALGKKLAITGKGRCNLTNASDAAEIMANVPTNAEFLHSCLRGFGSAALMDFFISRGVPLKVERGGRVFPESDRAGDIVGALKKILNERKVLIRYKSPAESLIIKDEGVVGVQLRNGEKVFADAVLISTGGASYPQTGSSGDGYGIAKRAGHSIIEPRPSLVPLITEEKWVSELEGLTLKNIAVSLYENEKKIFSESGEMLFTDRGVSGPVVLTASRFVTDNPGKNVFISIDLKPGLDETVLDNRLRRDFAENINRDFKNSLSELFPKRLIPVMVKLSMIDENKKVNSITKDERKKLLETIKNLRLKIIGTEGFEHSVVTRGGVSVREINPKTMESRLCRGLYFAGEIIDIDAFTGGYNLQIAFSTGVCAGRSMAGCTGA